MVNLVLTADSDHQVVQWYGATIHMKEPSIFIGKFDLTKFYICKVVMHTAEPSSTWEATEQMFKIVYSTYAKAYLKQVADNATQMNHEERNLLLILLEYS